MTESIPPVPGPGEGPTPPVDYEALAVAEAQERLFNAATVLDEYNIAFDSDQVATALDALAADARRRYRNDPEAFIAKTQSALGAVSVGGSLAGPEAVADEAAAPRPTRTAYETREAVHDPAIAFAQDRPMTFAFLDVSEDKPPISGANGAFGEVKKDALVPQIPLAELEEHLTGTQHDVVHIAGATNAGGRTVKSTKVFEMPKGVETGNVVEVAYAVGDREGAVVSATMFMDEREGDWLQDQLEVDPHFLRRAVASAMAKSSSGKVRAASTQLVDHFAQWDREDGTMRVWDRTVEGEEPEVFNVPAVAS